jgi:quinol monooxygenase YgiN
VGEVRLVVNLYVQPDRLGDFTRSWAEQDEEVGAEPGCQQYELFISSRNPGNVAVLEWWSSPEAYTAHWDTQQHKPYPGREFLGSSRDRRAGRNTTEIYWDRRDYRFDAAANLWRPR